MLLRNTITLFRWNTVGDEDDLTGRAVDNQGYGLPLQNIQQDRNKYPLEKQVTVESMETTFLTEIDEWVNFI